MKYLHLRCCGIILGLLLVLLASVGLAQEGDTSSTSLGIGDSVEITLEPDETQVYSLDLPRGESFYARSTINGETHRHMRILSPAGEALRSLGDRDRYIITEDGPHTLELPNNEETTATIRLEIRDIPTREIAVGERYTITEDDPMLFEVVFTLTEQQPVRFVSNGVHTPAIATPPAYLLFYLEQFSERVTRITDNSAGSSVIARILDPGSYRIVMRRASMESETEMGFIELQPATIYGGELSVGKLARTSADVQPVQYTVDLDAGERLHALVVSSGAHTYITDETGRTLMSYRHRNLRHAYAPLEMVAPADGTYTVHVYHPQHADGMVGDVIIATSRNEIPRTHDLENGVTFDFAADVHHYIASEWAGTRRLRLTTADGQPLDGAIQIEVVQLPDLFVSGPLETVMETEMRDTAEAAFTIENDFPGTFIILRGTDGAAAAINAVFEPIETTD